MNSTISGVDIEEINTTKQWLERLWQFGHVVQAANPDFHVSNSAGALGEFLKKRASARSFVIVDSGVLIGNLIVSADDDGFEVVNLCVHPDRQREGHGRALMQYGEALARSDAYPQMWLFTNIDNQQAQAFYAHLGYSLEQVVENYDGWGDTGVRFVKVLV